MEREILRRAATHSRSNSPGTLSRLPAENQGLLPGDVVSIEMPLTYDQADHGAAVTVGVLPAAADQRGTNGPKRSQKPLPSSSHITQHVPMSPCCSSNRKTTSSVSRPSGSRRSSRTMHSSSPLPTGFKVKV